MIDATEDVDQLRGAVWAHALISLGSNIEPRLQYLQRALKMLLEVDGVRLVAASSIYETEPVEVTSPQNCYLNAVIKIETCLQPSKLLSIMQFIERSLGRSENSKRKKTPRTIDLDLLIYDDVKIETPVLELPHPRMCDRAFILVPLCELSPELVLPNGVNVCQRAGELLHTQKVTHYMEPDEWLRPILPEAPMRSKG